MPARNLTHIRHVFEKSLDNSLVLVTELANYHVVDPFPRHVGVRRVEELTALALLKVHLSWEAFLEDSFLGYLCGGYSSSSYRPALLTPTARTLSDAYATVRGRANYLSWATKDALPRANAYFAMGEPYQTSLTSISTLLTEISTIRNRFAHRSNFAAINFRALLIKNIGHAPRGMTPGRFLLRNSTIRKLTNFEHYVNSLAGAAASIIP